MTSYRYPVNGHVGGVGKCCFDVWCSSVVDMLRIFMPYGVADVVAFVLDPPLVSDIVVQVNSRGVPEIHVSQVLIRSRFRSRTVWSGAFLTSGTVVFTTASRIVGWFPLVVMM